MPSIYKTSIIISIILLSLLVDKYLAGTCCEGDKICSGCWMCAGSDLRICWDRATSIFSFSASPVSLPLTHTTFLCRQMPAKCEAESDIQKKAACHCKAYAAIAKCWSVGTCCTEYAPTLVPSSLNTHQRVSNNKTKNPVIFLFSGRFFLLQFGRCYGSLQSSNLSFSHNLRIATCGRCKRSCKSS